MGFERPIAMAAVATLPFSVAAGDHVPVEIHQDAHKEIFAPFVEKPTYAFSSDSIKQAYLKQKLLAATSSGGVRISFSAPEIEDQQVAEDTPRDLVVEFKRLSSLTWDQMSQIFGVSTRALHDWKAGKTVSAENHQLLGKAVAMLRFIDRGTGEENKRLLLSEAGEGRTFFDLMKVGEFQAAMDLAGNGPGRVSFGRTLTDEARAKNAPQSFFPSADVAERVEVELLQRPQTRRKKLRRGKA